MRRILISLLPAVLIVLLQAAWGAAAEQAKPRAKIDISGHPFTGPANAPVTIVAFSDYL